MDDYGQRLDNIISFESSNLGLIKTKLNNIDEFNASWKELEANLNPHYLQELKELSTLQSIGSSTRIEGSTLQDEEVKELIKNLDISKLKSRDEEEVTGYYEVLELAYENFENIFLSEAYIKQLHTVLLKHSSKDTRHRGEYKSLPNKVVAHYPDGKSRVVFNTTEPYLTAKEMAELIDWTNERLAYPGIHPIIVIAAFVYEFLSIHPFQDGNGRLSRVLTNLLMMKAGFHFIRYISFEHIIEKRKKEYYQNLMEAQKHRFCKQENLTSWMIYFLDCIENTISKLQTKQNHQNNTVQIYNGTRQEKILNFIRNNLTAKVADLVKAFPEIPRPTIKYDLQKLQEQGLILQLGRSRGTYYRTA